MGITDWQITNSNFQSLYLGEAFVAGGGRFIIDFAQGSNTYQGSYRGAGIGLGASPTFGVEEMPEAVMRFLINVAPGIVSQLASDFIDDWNQRSGSRLYALTDEPLSAQVLNRSLFIINGGAEVTLNFNGALLLWCRRIVQHTVSSRTGATYGTSTMNPIAVGLVGGISPGAVSVSATITFCECSAFNS